ncbi:helix-turn-helix domain-containing protein, partial [Streptosporangium sp. NPDC048865]
MPHSAGQLGATGAGAGAGAGTARLTDIAAQAGVSEATVSRVLNGRPGVS